MALHHMIFLQLPILVWLLTLAKPAASQAKLDCHKCGNISIPYPFGTTQECSRGTSFLVNCITTDGSVDQKPFIPFGRIDQYEIMNISIPDGEIRVRSSIAFNCYDAFGKLEDNSSYDYRMDLMERYTFSDKRNKFTVVGCDIGHISALEHKTFRVGCIPSCYSATPSTLTNGSCLGSACCQTPIPKGLTYFYVFLVNSSSSYVWNYSRCSYAFLVEEKSYNFSTLDLLNFRYKTSVPVVLDWVIDNKTCEKAAEDPMKYACKHNSDCFYNENLGYQCRCNEGFEGNPYSQEGCQDVDECKANLHNCVSTAICHNSNGSYSCSCQKGYYGDGRSNGTGCNEDNSNNETSLAIKAIAGVLGVVLGCGGIYWAIRKRNIDKRREEYFKLNGGIILQQKLAHKDSEETVKIYSIEELSKATNGFDDDRIIGKGGFGTVYKGVLPKNKIVAIKKSKVADQIQSEQFANEFIVLSKINHINVVKLLGCCLETEVPLLVYEYIPNGTLSRHIQEVGHTSMPWGIRLRIASETAGALAYLHSAISPPIIHRDVKPSNILLDANYTAKVSDFGDSRLIPAGQTQLDTLVKGTIGYLDPEYLQTGQLTEKSDVYSFGVVLVELLTGENAICSEKTEEMRNLVAHFISSVKQNRLFQILDVRVMNDENAEQLKEVAKIAESCLRLKGEERPMMKEVAVKLEGLRKVEQHQFIQFELNLEETMRLLSEPTDICSTSTTIEIDSMNNQGLSPFEMDDGR